MTEYIYAQAGDVVLIIEIDTVLLFTIFSNGFVGENWLPDLETAKALAAHNVSGIPGGIGLWKPIPPEVPDPIEFGKDLLKNSN